MKVLCRQPEQVGSDSVGLLDPVFLIQDEDPASSLLKDLLRLLCRLVQLFLEQPLGRDVTKDLGDKRNPSVLAPKGDGPDFYLNRISLLILVEVLHGDGPSVFQNQG